MDITLTKRSNRPRTLSPITDKWQNTDDTGEFQRLSVKNASLPSPINKEPSQKIEERIFRLTVASKDDIWGLSNYGVLYRFDEDSTSSLEEHKWVHFKTKDNQLFRDITIAPNYCIFAIDKNSNTLYRIEDEDLSSAHNAYVKKLIMQNYKGSYDPGSSFRLIIPHDKTTVKQISCISHKALYAISTENKALHLEKHRFSKKYEWSTFGPDIELSKISVGRAHYFRGTELWAIRRSDRLPLRWDTLVHDWEVIGEEPIVDISITQDNSVYAIRKHNGELIKWDGHLKFESQSKSSLMNEQGGVIRHQLTNLCALKEGKHVYSVDRDTGDLLKMIVYK
ncbi:glutathione reductase, mitochondrial [Acrasis kona]|uniref:Glutathione reductase, mitochondrial n=1 Tax=Acrasis kona TaxID=1008807 RepID=A0AAW2YZZ5_9EUKA